jgi:adenine-specific DNA-methyltransferase
MEKLKMHSPDFTEQNVALLAELFPNCVTEAGDDTGRTKVAIDFDQLRQELSKSVVEGPRERYHLDWPGKKESLLAANAPIAKTLRPIRDESVDFDSTENLFIEGDNLDALKLLQEAYLNKVKMIYIDPPYNTGNDFIYDDEFAEDAEEFLKRSNQKDEKGRRLVANTESNGRFHSDWLSMIYPRLKLSRNLMAEDGAIFISIDHIECSSLRKLCDEVFGEQNCLGEICVVSNLKGRSDDKHFATAHNYLLAYAKNTFTSYGVPLPKEYLDEYPEVNSAGRRFRLQGLRKRGAGARREDRPNMFYSFFVDAKTGSVSLEQSDVHTVEVAPKLSDGSDGRWRWGRDTARKRVEELFGRTVGSEVRYDVFQIDFADRDGEPKRIKPKTLWMGPGFANETGTLEVKSLLGKGIFDTPKPTGLIKYIIQQAVEDGIVLDFFSGSCTAAHAVMGVNAEDDGNRRFIMVQLPEACDEKSEAFKAGFQTIAEIGKERIRRAGAKIKGENATTAPNLDVGFRVLKIDTSNMKDVYYAPDEAKQSDLLDQIENTKEGRTPEDLLFQVLLDWGVDLSLPIIKETIEGKAVFFIDDNALAACFDSEINEDLVKTLATRKPLRVVFRDSGYGNDSVKINVEQIFKLISPSTEVKSI